MSSGIFKTVKGQQEELSARDVKAEIIRIQGWTEAEYNARRKQLTKRINTFNISASAFGYQPESRTAVQILYSQSKAQQRYGKNYIPSQRTQLIYSMSATSGMVRGQKALESAKKKYGTFVTSRFAGLISSNDSAKKIYDNLKDNPAKLEKALSKFANDMHAKIDMNRRASQYSAIPFSPQSFGSDEYDVDITSYLI